MNREALDEHRLRRLVEVARELTGARYAALGVIDADHRELERFVFSGIDEETRRRIGDLPRGHGVLGELIRNPAPLRLRDVAAHPASSGFPPHHPPMRSFLGVPVLVRGEAWGNLYVAEKAGGGEFDEADQEALAVLAEWAALAIFNVRLYGQLEEERAALERAVHALEATTDIARAVGGETDRARVLETIARRCAALLHARSVLVLLRAGRRLEVAAGAGEGAVDALGSQLVLQSFTSEEALHAVRDHGIEASAALVAPLTFRGRGLGAIVALDRLDADDAPGPAFHPEDERLLAGAAASAATAVATVQSASEERLRQQLMTAERERARWARELHDSTLQGLGSRRVLLASALKRGAGPELEAAVREVVEDLSRDIEELRALITELRPATLDQIGLEAALHDLAERVAGAAGIELEMHLAVGDGRLDPELETAVYRLVQEALNNVAKHAGAGGVTLRVAEGDGRLDVVVADDGRGFDPAAAHRGFGVAGMRERVELVGGELDIESVPGSGTRVMAAIPLP